MSGSTENASGTNQQAFQLPTPALSKAQLKAIDALTDLEIAMIRTGYSRITSAAEFKAAYKAFASNLTYTTSPDDLLNESDLSCEDITVENSTVVIERAIQKELQAHAGWVEQARKDPSFDLREIPGFGDSIPSYDALEEPLKATKMARFDALLGKGIGLQGNRLSHTSILHRIVNLSRETSTQTQGNKMPTKKTQKRSKLKPQTDADPETQILEASDTEEQSQDALRDTTQLDSPLRLERHDLGSHSRYELSPDQIILRVAVYNPLTQQKTQEFLVLDDQPLTALRDLIVCVADDIDRLDWTTQQFKEGCGVHNNGCQCDAKTRDDGQIPLGGSGSMVPRPRACDLPTPSGFFFIEDCFYDDLRSSRAFRYSDSIIEWLSQSRTNQPLRTLSVEPVSPTGNLLTSDLGDQTPRFFDAHLAPATQSEMETTTFGNLRIRLGSHYHYQHQGNCSHVLIFTEMRCVTKTDIIDRRLYPLEVFCRKERVQKCLVCEMFPAEFVLYNDKLFDQSPTFTCGHCYRLSHEDSEGNLIYDDFQVYRCLPLPLELKSVADWVDDGKRVHTGKLKRTASSTDTEGVGSQLDDSRNE